MTVIPEGICPHQFLLDPARGPLELLKAIIVRSNFTPGIRHALGWRGVKACPRDVEAWTMKIAGFAGVFGIRHACNTDMAAETGAMLACGTFPVSYFPAPSEEMVDDLSLQAGAITQRTDYLERVRDYLVHHDLRNGFDVGAVRVTLPDDATGFCLGLESTTRIATVAEDGVCVDFNGAPVQLVAPGGLDQRLAAYPIALALFRVLAASAAFCMERPPEMLTEDHRPARIARYNSAGLVTMYSDADHHDIILQLGFGMAPPQSNALPVWQPVLRHDAAATPQPPEPYASEPWWNATPAGPTSHGDSALLGITRKPRLILLTGFLGAGKTSFLQHFIEYQTERHQFVAVIQNEIGKKGLDGKLLGQSYAVTEVDEGCVCCSLVGSLKAAITAIMEHFQPDDIVVETTGLANPANLLPELVALQDLVDFHAVITMLDAEHGIPCLDNYAVASSQVATADIIIINKSDLIDATACETLCARVRQMAPHARLLLAQHGDVPPSQLDLHGAGREAQRAGAHAFGLPDLRNHEHDRMSSRCLTIAHALDRATFERCMAALPQSIFRLKGVVQFSDAETPHVVQYVGGRGTITPAPADMVAPEPFLIAIGRDMETFDTQWFFS